MKRILKYISSITAVTSTAATSLYFLGYIPAPREPDPYMAVILEIDSIIKPTPPLEDPELVEEQPPQPPPPPTFHYIEIYDTCGPRFEGPCVNMRAGPGTEFPIVLRLRSGMVFKVAEETTSSSDGLEWYKIILDETLRRPDRVTSDWYVAVNDEIARPFTSFGEHLLSPKTLVSISKRIVVDISESMLYAYDADNLFMETPVSVGTNLTPTPKGSFSIYRKTPSRYMQGPLPEIADSDFDLPGIPWDLYFSYNGAAIHGAYWHNDFGEPRSHGCVNVFPEEAKELYAWADLGTPVIVQQ